MAKKGEKERGMKKGAIEMDQLGWWLLGLVILAILIAGYIVLKGKGEGALAYVRDLFRFGGAS